LDDYIEFVGQIGEYGAEAALKLLTALSSGVRAGGGSG
jgi:hypothetical protein